MIQKLKCLFGFHDEYVSHAKNRREGECTRQYYDGREPESVDGCTLVLECKWCDCVVDELQAPASVADRNNLWGDLQ